MFAGVLHQLRRRVKAHGLRIDQRREKTCRFMALQPAADVHQLGKTGGVAFRKTVFAKAFNLLEDAFGKCRLIPALNHPADQPVVKALDTALSLPRGHRAAQIIGLTGGKVSRDHGNLHHLLLKNRHAQGAAQGAAQFFIRISFLRRVGTALQVWVHHAAHNRAGPHYSYFHHQIVKAARPQSRQHAHLRAAFNLKNTHRVGFANHVVSLRVTRRDLVHLQVPAAPLVNQLQAAANSRQHAERQHVNFQQPHRIKVVFVPLNDAAVFHRGGLNRHQPRQLGLRQHKAADVLAQVARKAEQLHRQVEPLQDGPGVFRVADIGFLQPLGQQAAFVKPKVFFGELLNHLRRNTKGFAHIPNRAAGPVGCNCSGNGCVLVAVFGVNVLNDFFTPLVLKIYVNIGRLFALAADETLKQQLAFSRVYRRNGQAIAHGRVSSRAAALAQDLVVNGELHDVMHGDEIHGVAQLINQRQFVLNLSRDFFRQALRVAL